MLKYLIAAAVLVAPAPAFAQRLPVDSALLNSDAVLPLCRTLAKASKEGVKAEVATGTLMRKLGDAGFSEADKAVVLGMCAMYFNGLIDARDDGRRA